MRKANGWAALSALVIGALCVTACGDKGGEDAEPGVGGSGGSGGFGGSGTGALGGGVSGGMGGVSGGMGGASGGMGGASGGVGSGTGGGTGGGADLPSVTGPASLSADGVLTNRPNLSFVTTDPIEIVNAYFVLHELSSFNSVQVWGEVQNTGSELLCIPLAEISIGGQPIIAIVDGPAYEGSSTLSMACLEPGAKGVFAGIENEVSATLLDTAGSVTYSITGLSMSYDVPIPHPAQPEIVSPVLEESNLGWVLSGSIRARSTGIYNLELAVYPRDPSGLIFDDTSAYPNELADILPLQELPFETYTVEHPFAEYELFQSFIVGNSSMSAPVAGPAAERMDAAVARRADRKQALEQLKGARGE